MVKPIEISVVSYINTWPFLYGLIKHPQASKVFIPRLDYPAAGAKKIIGGEVPLGLLPVGGLPNTNHYRVVTSYCLGTEKTVGTVKLFSYRLIEQVEQIILDYQSTTSVLLTKVLFHHHWKRKVDFIPLDNDEKINTLSPNEALLLIGDRCFGAEKKFPFAYDLGEEWYKFSGLPFAFAVWVAHRSLNPEYIEILEQALQWGIQHLDEAITHFNQPEKLSFDAVKTYLTQNITFDLTDRHRQAVDYFLTLANDFVT